MARIDVVMPQMGESIAEGTLSRWLKKLGDAVKRDEPMFEISTDKVDAEIPAPAAGVLAEILVQEGETVAVQTVVARLETEVGAAVAAPPAARATPPAPAPARAAPAPAPAPAAAAPARRFPPRPRLPPAAPAPPPRRPRPPRRRPRATGRRRPPRIASAGSPRRSYGRSRPSTISTFRPSRAPVSPAG